MEEQNALKDLFASAFQEEIIADFDLNIIPDYEGSNWQEVNRYYDSMEPVPYSMRDMEEIPFHEDLCKQPDL